MNIAQKLENGYSNLLNSIKKMSNGIEKDLAIGNLALDIGERCITTVADKLGVCYRKVKNCINKVLDGEQLSFEFRGRKKLTAKYPKLISDMESVIENYKLVDSHFKSDNIYISINPTSIINELITKYNYPKKFACYNTIRNILQDMGYKFHKIPKSEVVEKIPETDKIFENVKKSLIAVKNSDDTVAAISIDDKATKKIGKLSDGGSTWTNIKALDHDTKFDYSIKPFGILDLKTNETFVTCTPYSSTAEFKVDCIDDYIKYKKEHFNLERLVIFLDNGPENSSKRTLWLKRLVNLSKIHNITIELVYYPPYHSKYNKIERYWARLQMFWSRIIINNLEKLFTVLNKVTWCDIKTKAKIILKEYKKGIKVSKEEMEQIKKHIIRHEGLEKWSIIITPFIN